MIEQNKTAGELLSYVGVEIDSLLKQGYSPSQTKHLVSSQLLELVMKTVAVKNDNEYDYYALKPMFVAFKYLIDMEYNQKKEFSYLPEVQADLANLKNISNYLEHRISVIQESKD